MASTQTAPASTSVPSIERCENPGCKTRGLPQNRRPDGKCYFCHQRYDGKEKTETYTAPVPTTAVSAPPPQSLPLPPPKFAGLEIDKRVNAGKLVAFYIQMKGLADTHVAACAAMTVEKLQAIMRGEQAILWLDEKLLAAALGISPNLFRKALRENMYLTE